VKNKEVIYVEVSTQDGQTVKVPAYPFTDCAVHVKDLPENYQMHQDDVLVEDGWAYISLLSSDAITEIEEVPIIIVAKITVKDFKVYWGYNVETVDRILSWGRKLTNEKLARQYFPMLDNLNWAWGSDERPAC
jgi:hypothetical protein